MFWKRSANGPNASRSISGSISMSSVLAAMRRNMSFNCACSASVSTEKARSLISSLPLCKPASVSLPASVMKISETRPSFSEARRSIIPVSTKLVTCALTELGRISNFSAISAFVRPSSLFNKDNKRKRPRPNSLSLPRLVRIFIDIAAIKKRECIKRLNDSIKSCVSSVILFLPQIVIS